MTVSIVIANRLDDGRVVYFTGNSWTPSVSQACRTNDNDVAKFQLEKAQNHPEANHLLGIENVYLSNEDDNHTAISIRDRIRINGPTIKFGLAAQK